MRDAGVCVRKLKVSDDSELTAHFKKDFIEDQVWSLVIDLLIFTDTFPIK